MTIHEALSDAGFLCCHPPYKGATRTYVTYQSMGQTGVIFAEGKEAETGAMFAVDLFTDGEFVPMIAAVKAALADAGYSCLVDQEIYETETSLWHIAMTATTEGGIYG